MCLIAAVCLLFLAGIASIAAQQRIGKQHAGQKQFNKKVLKKLSAPQKKSGRSRTASGVEAQRRELLKVESDIKATRSQLSRIEKKESSTLQKIAVHEKHSSQLVQHIDLMENHLAILNDSINTARHTVQMLKTRHQQIQQSYTKITQEFYKAGAMSADELIATGRPSDTEMRRTAYMKALTKRLNEQVHQMAEVKDSIARQQQLLKTHTEEQQRILKMKAAHRNELVRSIQQEKVEIEKLRSSKQQLRQELAKKEQSARQIGSMISRLIAEDARKRDERRKEIARQELLKKHRAEKLAQQQNSKKAGIKNPAVKKELVRGESSNLASKDITPLKDEPAEIDNIRSAFKPNSLSWPVGSRKILRSFGQYRNPSTNTITDNPGIDIAASSGSGVQAVSSGVVSLLHWLPGYGSLVIVDHENGFRSVYANLASVSVREGQKVSAGSIIGRSGESVDGEFVHFELWRERQKLNPVSWLR